MSDALSSMQNPQIKHVVKLQTDRQYRTEHQQVVIEGRKMVSEVAPLQQIFATKDEMVSGAIEVAPEVMKKISSVKSPEGIVAIAEMPPFSTLESVGKILVFDGIQDPGNLGTLMRTGLAFGWTGIYLLGNCCDPYNDKALRSAKGATFRLKLYQGDDAHLKELSRTHQILVADLDGKSPETLTEAKQRILVLGSESHGVSAACQALGEAVTLPISGDMESLNVAVAGGILMYLL